MSCLFNSMQHFIAPRLGKNSAQIRAEICDYLAADRPLIDGIATAQILAMDGRGSAAEYVAHMRSTSTWGGAIEIQAACNLWKSRIVVHDLRDRGKRASIEFVSCDAAISGATELTMELEWTGGHYEPVRK